MPLSVAVPVTLNAAKTVTVAVSAVFVDGVNARRMVQLWLMARICPLMHVPPRRVKSRALAPVMEMKGVSRVVCCVPVFCSVMVVMEELPWMTTP